jgi:hypothetical protein
VWLVSEDNSLKENQGEADEAETEDLATLECNFEAFSKSVVVVKARGSCTIAIVSGLYISDCGNSHAQESGHHRCGCADKEGHSGVREGGTLDIVDSEEDHCGKKSAENGKIGILFG